MGVAHLALDLGPRGECCDRVHHDDIDGTAPDQCFGDLERLLACVRLGDEKIVCPYSELACINDIKGMFRIDESGLPACLLRLGDDMESECGLARGLGTVDLNDPAARNAAYAEGYVKAKGAR